MTRMFQTRPAAVIAACAAMGVSASVLAADIAITDLAPKDSVFVFSINDYKQMRAAFDRTGFKDIWSDPGVQKWFERHTAEHFEQMQGMLDEMGIDKEDIKHPAGMVGGAMWLTLDDDNEIASHVLLAADYAAEAESMSATIEKAIDEGLDRDQLIVDEEEYAGVTVFEITPIEQEEEDGEDAEDEMEWEFEDDGGPFNFDQETIFYARAGELLLMSSDKRAIEDSIDRITGGKDLSTIDENPDYGRSLKQIGSPHMSASVLITPWLDMMKRAEEAQGGEDDEFGMMMPDPSMLAKAAGFDEIKAIALGITFDADAGMLEQTWSVICPTKRGLVALFDNPTIDNTPPAFVSSATTSYSSFQFRFADLLPTIREIAGTLPDEMGQQILQGLGMAEGMVGPIFAQLDPHMFIAQNYNRPFAADSQSMLFGMKAKDQAALTDAIVGFVNTGMAPLQSRDFLGNTIWEMNPGMGGPEIAMGVGGGYMFMGKPAEIENALRAAGAKNSPLAEDEGFKQAAASVGPNAMGFAFTDMRTTIEYLDWTIRNYEKVVRAQFSGPEWQDDPEMKEFAEEMIKSQVENMPSWMQDMPPLDVVIKAVGDMAAQMKSTPDGFTMRSVVLRPGE